MNKVAEEQFQVGTIVGEEAPIRVTFPLDQRFDQEALDEQKELREIYKIIQPNLIFQGGEGLHVSATLKKEGKDRLVLQVVCKIKSGISVFNWRTSREFYFKYYFPGLNMFNFGVVGEKSGYQLSVYLHSQHY